MVVLNKTDTGRGGGGGVAPGPGVHEFLWLDWHLDTMA